VVKIEHTNGFMSIYAHNLQNLVNVGDRVEAGGVVAPVGKGQGAGRPRSPRTSTPRSGARAWPTPRSSCCRGATSSWRAPTRRCRRRRLPRTMKTSEAEEPEERLADVESSLENLLAASDEAVAGPKAPPETAEKQRALLGMYLDEIRRIKLLDAAEEHALAVRVRAGDAEAERHLIEANLRLVISLAKRYVNRG